MGTLKEAPVLNINASSYCLKKRHTEKNKRTVG